MIHRKNIVYPENCRGVIDVTKPPYNLDNTGKTDCAEMLVKLPDDILYHNIPQMQEVYDYLLSVPHNCVTREGGVTEISGGAKELPLILNDESTVTAIFATVGVADSGTYPIAAKEIRNGRESVITDKELPVRGWPWYFLYSVNANKAQWPPKKDDPLCLDTFRFLLITTLRPWTFPTSLRMRSLRASTAF